MIQAWRFAELMIALHRFSQTSSAILSHLETQVMPSLAPQLPPTSPSHGLSPVSLQPLATLSLAQAQECFWQKAVSDGMKSGTVAKLAAAVEELYEQAADQAKRAEIEHGIEAIPRVSPSVCVCDEADTLQD